jgi:ABC-type multidrug transport system fused ATPase/permease subunit
MGIASVYFGRKIRNLNKKYLDDLALSNSKATETITNIRTVRYFSGEKNDLKNYELEINKTLILGIN